MFCPKCGAENPETYNYCRVCRENLQLISQAMKGRLPVVIASKVDQALDSRSERFRRDSILNLLMSLTVLVGGSMTWLGGDWVFYGHPLVFLPATFLFASAALLDYRAYRRSNAPDFDWTGPDKDPVDSLAYKLGMSLRRACTYLSRLTSRSEVSLGLAGPVTSRKGSPEEGAPRRYPADGSPPSVTESTTQRLDPSANHSQKRSHSMYCPRCGTTSNQHDVLRCPGCGMNLELIAEALEPVEQDQRMARLDRFIRRKNNALAAASHRNMLFAGCMFLGSAILSMTASQQSTQSHVEWWYLLGSAVVSLVAGFWDRIVYRRNPAESKTTAQIKDPSVRVIDAPKSKSIREWQQRYPDLWMLIEVTLEDESGVSEGKLIATAEDRREFFGLDASYDERYIVAIYGGIDRSGASSQPGRFDVLKRRVWS